MFHTLQLLSLSILTQTFAAPTAVSDAERALTTPAPECAANCVAHIDAATRYRWKSYEINTTITAATLQHLIYPLHGNATRTRIVSNFLPKGYELPEKDVDGTIITTLKLNEGNGKTIKKVLRYPMPFTKSPSSYWWTGTRELMVSGTATCVQQSTPTTLLISPNQTIAMQSGKWRRDHIALAPTATPYQQDGNFMLVAEEFPLTFEGYRSVFSNDTISQCHFVETNSTAKPAKLVLNLKGAAFVTVTTTKTETQCAPDIMCNVRQEVTQAGTLQAPSAKGQVTLLHGMPKVDELDEKSMIVSQSNLQAQREGPRPMGVKIEQTATALAIPAMTVMPGVGQGQNYPQPAPQAQPLLASQPKATQAAIVSNAMPIGKLQIEDEELTVAILPQAGSNQAGSHLEQAGMLIQIGSTTAEIGETVTIKDQLVLVTEAPDGNMIFVVAATDAASPTSTILLTHNGNSNANANSRLGHLIASPHGDSAQPVSTVAAAAVTATANPRLPVTVVGSVILMPDADGGYSVAGKILSNGGALTIFGSDPRAEFLPSPILLSLTTNTAGQEVFGVNGETLTMAAPMASGTTSSSTSVVSSTSQNSGSQLFYLHVQLRLMFFGISIFVLHHL